MIGPFARTMWPWNARFLPTCNVFYWRADLEAAEGFDEAFATPAGEDTDLGLRIRKLGRQIVLDDRPLVYHDVRANSFRQTLGETLRWVNLPRLIAKHPEVRKELLHARIFWRPSHPRVLLAASGLILTPWFPPAAVLAIPWVTQSVSSKKFGPSRRRRVVALPGRLVVDLLEVAVMARGSLRHRTVML
jgi:hypothetical protein